VPCIVSGQANSLQPLVHTDEWWRCVLSATQVCPVHFVLKHENKGFEGLHYQQRQNGDDLLMGLCEGETCY
jgi:hypothetical protein